MKGGIYLEIPPWSKAIAYFGVGIFPLQKFIPRFTVAVSSPVFTERGFTGKRST
jgi:hypothetical protein